MKYVGLVVYIEPFSFWWSDGGGSYLLGEYQSHDEMVDIYEYQRTRFYKDEVRA